jgi:hypothetical protein
MVDAGTGEEEIAVEIAAVGIIVAEIIAAEIIAAEIAGAAIETTDGAKWLGDCEPEGIDEFEEIDNGKPHESSRLRGET